MILIVFFPIEIKTFKKTLSDLWFYYRRGRFILKIIKSKEIERLIEGIYLPKIKGENSDKYPNNQSYSHDKII